MGGNTTVTVHAFGLSAELVGWPSREVELPVDATLAALIERLEAECPRLVEARGQLRFAVNEQYAADDATLKTGDEVALIPPVSGGDHDNGTETEPFEARLTNEPLDAAALTAEIERPESGALATFAGVVRGETSDAGQTLLALEYTAYESMALAEMQRIMDAAAAKYGLNGARLVHRLGTLSIGEASVIAVVSSGHRAEAFDACREMIEELKVRVPIFKREIWADGSRSWVEGEVPS